MGENLKSIILLGSLFTSIFYAQASFQRNIQEAVIRCRDYTDEDFSMKMTISKENYEIIENQISVDKEAYDDFKPKILQQSSYSYGVDFASPQIVYGPQPHQKIRTGDANKWSGFYPKEFKEDLLSLPDNTKAQFFNINLIHQATSDTSSRKVLNCTIEIALDLYESL